MNFLRIGVFTVLFGLSGVLLSQKNSGQSQTIDQPAKNNISSIISSSFLDSVLLKVEVKNAHYDQKKNNLPYYIISNTTTYNQTANPSLITKKTQIVTEPHASVIKKLFSSYLTQNFELMAIPSLCRNENFNQHTLIPFRLNNQNQIEELIDYTVNWQVSTNNNRKAASAAAFKNNSVLATGTWYKIGITKTGFHKIDKTFLTNLGVNFNGLDPKKIKIYGNGGRMLPELNSSFRYDDLEENAIQIVGEGDGVFDNGDYIIFYGKVLLAGQAQVL